MAQLQPEQRQAEDQGGDQDDGKQGGQRQSFACCGSVGGAAEKPAERFGNAVVNPDAQDLRSRYECVAA